MSLKLDFFSDVSRFLLTGMAGIAMIGSAMAQSASPTLFTPTSSLQGDLTQAQNTSLSRVSKLPTVASVQVVKIDLNALAADATRMILADGQSVEFGKQKVDHRSNQSYTWYGNLAGVQGQAILVVNNGAITGTIHHGKEIYRLEPLADGLHALVKIKQSGFPPDHPPSFKQIKPGPMPKYTHPAIANQPVIIDVLVAYTTGAKNATGDIGAKIQLAIDEANQSYINSNINLRLAKVDSFEVAYSEAGRPHETIVADFAANPTVTNRRNASGADVAIMLINQPSYCGYANAIMANANNAYAVVHYDCATGYYSFAHEIGHLQGARHDNDSSSTPYAFGHGYRYGSWRTVMAYGDSSIRRLPFWSNPNINYEGVAMGTPTYNDNARVLNTTASTLANFRQRASIVCNGISLNPPSLPYSGGNASAQANCSGGGALSYTWVVNNAPYGGNAATISGQIGVNGSASAQSWPICVTASNGSINSNQVCTTLSQAGAPPSCSVALTPASLPVGGGAASAQANCSASPTSYAWTLNGAAYGGDTASISGTVGANPGPTQNYTICVNASNQNGSGSACTILTQAGN